MRTVLTADIKGLVAELCARANTELRADVLAVLKAAYKKEKDYLAKDALAAILQNARTASSSKMPICQDTGLPYVFIELGQQVALSGIFLNAAVNAGVSAGYSSVCCRESVVKNPLLRNGSAYTPAVIHSEIVPGDKVRITVLPKGFGSENKTRLKMFKPTQESSEIVDFVLDAVKAAGADACPPYIVGVGIGGGADSACLLAKKALLRDVRKRSIDPVLKRMEAQILLLANRLGIGPMGMGGKQSVLAVNIDSFPTHIAGLPVAVNISCHALRSASALI